MAVRDDASATAHVRGELHLRPACHSEFLPSSVFTGWRDPELTEMGIEEAHAAWRSLRDAGMSIGAAFTSNLVRARTARRIILDEFGLLDAEQVRHPALNKRDYGTLSGLDKD